MKQGVRRTKGAQQRAPASLPSKAWLAPVAKDDQQPGPSHHTTRNTFTHTTTQKKEEEREK